MAIGRKADQKSEVDREMLDRVKEAFRRKMDDDLEVERAFDRLYELIKDIEPETLKPKTASELTKGLREVDEILRVIFYPKKIVSPHYRAFPALLPSCGSS